MAGESPLSFGATVSLSATSSTGRATLPALNSNQLVITNLGPDLAYVTLGSATVVATSTTGYPMMPGTQIVVTINPTIVAGAAICATTTATILFTAADGALHGLAAASTSASGGTTENVNVLSVIPGTGATNLGKAEDAVHTSGDVGVMALGVATDGSSTLNAAGDYSVLGTDTAGNMRVVGSVASGATDSGNPVKVAGIFKSALPTLTDGQRGDLQLNSAGKLINAPGIVGAAADALANTLAFFFNGPAATFGAPSVLPQAFNGTTWDRVRNAGAAGTGLLAELGPYSYSRKTADGQVKGSAGFLHTLAISPTGTVTAGVLTIYDSLTETGTIIYSCSLPITTFATIIIPIDVSFTTGLFIGFDATLANVQVLASFR